MKSAIVEERNMSDAQDKTGEKDALLESDTVRRKIFFDLFPDVCREGKLNVEALCQALDIPSPLKPDSRARLGTDQVHELRNTAAVIQSGARLLQRRCTLQPEASSIIDALMKAVESLSRQLKS